MKVDYDELGIICDDDLSEEVVEWLYGVLIDRLIEEYGEEALEDVMGILDEE